MCQYIRWRRVIIQLPLVIDSSNPLGNHNSYDVLQGYFYLLALKAQEEAKQNDKIAGQDLIIV